MVSEETVEEKEPTSTGTKPLPVTKKPAKKKKKKSRKEEKGKEYFDMWMELIQQVGEIMEFPPSFGESQLCLIPKVENIPHPDQFRPISVTNSDYRIVMRY